MAMLPRFRSDLTAAREEQQGVVFYRIDDPDTQTSFRLYEIEYLIAQKLDGQRDMGAVIAAVKEEYNFDISEPDLKKFVSQLESMGFVTAGPAAPTPSEYGEDDPTTQIMPGEELRARVGATMDLSPADEAASFDATQKVSPEQALEARIASEGMMASAGAGAVAITSESVDSEEDATIPLGVPAPSDLPPIADAAPMMAADEPPPEPIVLDSPVDESETIDISGVTAEHDRLLDSAVDYLRQGYVVHARDYFLAARENRKGDERITKMISALDDAGEEPDPDVLGRLKALGVELFPDAGGGVVNFDAYDDAADLDEAHEEDLRTRVIWSLVLVAILAVGLGGGWWALRALRILEGTAKVSTVDLQSAAIPVYYPDPAVQVSPRREEWLTGPGPGTVVTVPQAGAKFEEGAPIIVLSMSPKAEKTLARAEAALEKARTQLEKASQKLTDVEAEREQLEVARDEAQARIKELKPGGIMDKSAKQEIDKYKKAKVRANKKLTQLAKKARKLAAQQKKAEAKLEAAGTKLATIRERTASKFLRAPYPGTVVEVKAAVDQDLTGDEKTVLFRDHLAAKVVFQIEGKGSLLAGGQAQVKVGNGKPAMATVSSVEPTDSGQKLEVELPDPGGAYAEMDASSFRLVREVANPAFEIDSDAVVEPQGETPFVILVFQNRAAYRDVELLYRDANIAVIRPAAGSFRDGDKIVVDNPDGAVADLPEDIALEIE